MLFSTIMAVYHANDCEEFKAAVESVFDQSVPPSELIISVDGPVGENLERELAALELLQNIRVLRLDKNIGPGGSRHAAIQAAKQDIVAVMDADDLCAPNRFELQLQLLESTGADVVGGFIEEFDQIPGDSGRIRTVPLEHTAIIRRGHWNQPMNHVTIMFRKSVYEKVGGYHTIRCVEDYDLFHRMFVAGVRFANTPEVLVYVRCGTAVLSRRRGVSYLSAELALLRRMLCSGFISKPQWIVNSSIRILVRLMPSSIIRLLYKMLMRKQSGVSGVAASGTYRKA
jgi:glycosyltransferase involved in cell wall biosynthesis